MIGSSSGDGSVIDVLAKRFDIEEIFYDADQSHYRLPWLRQTTTHSLFPQLSPDINNGQSLLTSLVKMVLTVLCILHEEPY
ncbi:hypothetical protein BL250_04815 [Erwinia sp. OLTSP20]|nr:hypothetical protein BV501_12720 [Erwinia sp. OAMSP11]PIJ68978.1 hypothetical protein BK416_15600 [Erwinia sp. OLSSP12]PIJ80978.1 hypothetical protein BLD46_13515 [Erwinia sp. OLMTSP26]PIJ83381.1 hypothetical protein BLD49_13200 [Erwinia sp. OLMDSP33]PIJ84294.1 hypothetical protein BLD47_02835 [Erwinia sp. OLCASP19]PIJ92953.1 hypothetical protein BL249_05500 [Erwinia sp. OLFS4]PIJ94005.1 hypothetical protein BL250_04815 [Erwinia sp. OLTSP20]